MFDDQLLDQLESSNVEVRKQAVKRLAQTKDRAALPYLADVYRHDSDPDVRELARKGGLYIKKYAPDDYAPPVPSLYDDDEDEGPDVRDVAPLPSEIYVSQAQIEKAQGHIAQALDMHMRGDNERAAGLLGKALKANPRLVHDSYTLSLAATVTGLDSRTAVQMLAPSAEELSKRKAAPQQKARPAGVQGAVAYVVMIAAAVVLAGYFLFPWFDISATPATDVAGQSSTVAATWDQQMSLVLAIADDFEEISREAGVPVPEEIRITRRALGAIHWDLTGLNTALLTTGGIDTLAAFGFNDAIENASMLNIGLETRQAQAEIAQLREPLPAEGADYALFLVPVAGIVALILAFVLLMRQSLLLWGLVVLAGLAAVGPMAYFFTVGEPALREKINWQAFMEVAAPEQSLIALGFWVTMIGAMAVLVLPFVAMLSIPQAEPQAVTADRL